MARFFFKTETEKNILSCLCTWGVAKVGLVVLFCRFGALSGFCGSRKIYFPFEVIFSCRLLFSLRFFPAYSGFMNANCVAVFVACFLFLNSSSVMCAGSLAPGCRFLQFCDQISGLWRPWLSIGMLGASYYHLGELFVSLGSPRGTPGAAGRTHGGPESDF